MVRNPKTTVEPSPGSRSGSTLSLALEYIFEVKEIEEWVEEARAKITSDVLEADEIS